MVTDSPLENRYESVQVLRRSIRLAPIERLRPSSRESAAGLAYVAAALSCAAPPAPPRARSRALMLGTTYPPASAAAGARAAAARMSLRMVVPPLRRGLGDGRQRARGEERRDIVLGLQGDARRGLGVGRPVGEEVVGHRPRRAGHVVAGEERRHRAGAAG